MTKLIAILAVVLAVAGVYGLWSWYDRIEHEKEADRLKAQAAIIEPRSLAGMPYQLEESLQKAQNRGGGGLRDWLKAYGDRIQDPRKAWIQLDYCVAIIRDNPAEARRLFAEVKNRLGPDSPVWPRIKQLEKTLE
jgi:hypothetical protein